jgi:hypothetical protein
MLSKFILASLVSLFSVSLSARAETAINPQSMVGTWILERSDNPMPDGSVVPYCTGVHGMIIYTAEGFVSVALNCAATGNGNEPADISGRKFFYAGRYTVNGSRVTHHLANASQTELMGTSFTRDITINDNRLILSGQNQGQAFAAHWVRVEK